MPKSLNHRFEGASLSLLAAFAPPFRFSSFVAVRSLPESIPAMQKVGHSWQYFTMS
jgi:hypothetical protein